MIGTTLSHYKITATLGIGGMGEVYHAEDTKLGRRVALKILPAEMAANPERLERFQREAKVVASLNHPNIVTIHSVEEADGLQFLTMELVEGDDLERLLPADGFSLAKIFDIAVPLADALATAHEKGIVHRDLKPANVMLTKEGRVKVLDFGLAKLGLESPVPFDDQGETALAPSSAPLTGDGTILGTAPYMSPEQLEGLPVDHRADIFSVGVLLYELATGRRPFEGASSIALASSILRDAPPPISEIKQDLPRHFGRIIETCLEKDPERRYQTAKDLRNALQSLQRETESGLSSSIQSELTARPEPPAPAPSRRPLAAVGIAAAVAIALVAVFFLLRSQGFLGGSNAPPSQPEIGSEAQLLLEQSRTYSQDGATLPKLKLAEQTLRRALALEPENAFLQAEMAQLLAGMQEEYPQEERREEALELADKALSANPALEKAWLARGELSMLEGDGEAAAEAAQHAMTIDPSNVRGRVLHGQALLEQGRREEGLNQLRQAVEMDGGAITARYALGTALLRMGQLDEATVEFKRVLEYAPGHISAMNNLANAYLYSGRYLEAVPLYHRALELAPDEVAATNLGTAYYYLDQMEESLAAYLEAEELQPGYPTVQNNIGDVYAKLGDPPSARTWYLQAIDSCDQRLAAGGDRVELLGLRALVAAKVGLFEEAIGSIEEVLNQTDSAPDQPELLYSAAQIYALAGERENMLDYAERSMKAGYPREEFRRAPEFAAFQDDPAFTQLMVSRFDGP
ncbi:MAG: protein kinase [Nitrospirae bacterium]|nr:protein kinase [Nitrospirota bacterium]